ncbi:putative oxido [Cyphellophora attinorum]|uniref:Putative oxido n=1 Tax=Cyphellophora attinorum TaxID=1664694 RepID=A0A0N0NNT4_9EURO|nr:putative oxido [Phialophora attinorum]KPI41918.1 putative oxido [Phialophora attinorum]
MSDTQKNTTYLITGGNRGIALGLVTALLSRPSTTVIASVRNKTSASQLESEISKTSVGTNSKLYIIFLDLATVTSPQVARDALQDSLAKHITHIDVLISSAAIISSMGPSLTTTSGEMQSHFQANSTAQLMLFQAFWPLLQASAQPKSIAITSSVGSIGAQEPFSGGAYGPSKAALNWIVKRLHLELQKEGLVSVAVHPGWVQTEGGQFAADAWSYPGKPPLTIEQSVTGVLSVIDGASRDTVSGKFMSYDGTELVW